MKENSGLFSDLIRIFIFLREGSETGRLLPESVKTRQFRLPEFAPGVVGCPDGHVDPVGEVGVRVDVQAVV